MPATSFIEHFKPTQIDAADLPWHPFIPYNEKVMLKLLHSDLVRGESTLMLKAPGGEMLGAHDHYGRVMVYTVQGTWAYDEHDWSSTAGDFVYEVANAQHTFRSISEEDVVVFIVVEGAIAFLEEDGKTIKGIETAHTFAKRYEDYCEANGLEVVDMTEFALS